MFDHQILLFLSWLLAIVLIISLLLLQSSSNSGLQKQKPSSEKMKTRSMSNKPDQANDLKKNEAPQAGRRTTRQAANKTSQANQPWHTGNVTTREAAAGSRAIVPKGRGGGERRGMLARSGLLQGAGADPDNNNFRTALADIARREMARAPRPQTRGSMAHRQLHRSDITTTSVAPTEVMSGSGYDARQTQAEVIKKGGPAHEKKRHRRDCPSRGTSVIRPIPGNTVLRPRTRARVMPVQNDLQQCPRERVRREIPQGPQPMSIDQPNWGMERRANYESRSRKQAPQFNIQSQPMQDTDAGVVSNQLVVEDHVKDKNRSRLPPDSVPIQTNINEEFRARMFDYLRSMQEKGEMLEVTYQLSKNLLDRYCSVAEISEENWQIFAVAALFVASKYEEVWPKKVHQFEGRRFLLSEVIRTEQVMLRALDYKITIPTPVDYVRRFIKEADSGEEEKNLAFCLANLNLGEMEMRHSPAFIAAAAVYAAQCRIRGAPEWTIKLERFTGYIEEELKDCALLMLQLQFQRNVV